MDVQEIFHKVITQTLQEGIASHLQSKIKNLAFILEDEPSEEVRVRESLTENETLLGYYQGIPLIERGEGYGIGAIVPDTITIYRLPILEESKESGVPVETIIRDTVLHEVAHYFGMNEDEVHSWEKRGRTPHAHLPGGHLYRIHHSG